jgi:NTP pyrophosphatase (non-canonical NTP hydrolase)
VKSKIASTDLTEAQANNIMNLSDYQTRSRVTAKYPPIGHAVIYPALGLTNEAGEVAGKIKKIFRDKGGEFGDADRAALAAELGDVLWYLAQVATELDLSLDDIAQHNLDKLMSRLERGKIGGDGDTR